MCNLVEQGSDKVRAQEVSFGRLTMTPMPFVLWPVCVSDGRFSEVGDAGENAC